jgi:ATP-binding cassette subfamily B protein
METLLRYYGNVLQKSEPFTGTVFENVLFGVSHFDMPNDTDVNAWQQLRDIATQALAKAGLPVSLFPHGLDERVGYKGMKLSGGQQQRLQIAGAHCKLMLGGGDRPRLILADEPTASLDSLSELTVMQHLQDELPEGTTMLMVAHRLSTVANMDKIVFVRPLDRCDNDTAQVTMHDSLAELYEAEALFREMADAQKFVPEGIRQAA